MACVTLKRPLDFDPLEALHSPDRPQTKRRRCTPIKGMDRESNNLNLPQPPESATGLPSVFLESVLSADEIASNLRDELKRLKHRRQLASQEMPSTSSSSTSSSAMLLQHHHHHHHASPNSPEPMNQEANEASSSSLAPSRAPSGGAVNHSCGLQSQQQSSSSSSSSSTLSSSSSSSSLVKNVVVPSVKSWMGTRDKPVFTLKQMTLICERMCKERTEQVRQEYDRILQQKLCEQYDAFVKFIDQQIQERFHRGQLPSYLS